MSVVSKEAGQKFWSKCGQKKKNQNGRARKMSIHNRKKSE